ncbi:MAG: DNA repair protein RecN [Ktedonobacterales bacterium]|jgi:DNA repair protein RecN (Recombination protein N)|nr:MAG: DNA repair protein RecN [Ktedonobacterales bacterium]
MLLELTINNFAIIDSLRLTFDPHFNVFTGETGAGKSILIDAISALVGERTGSDVVRAGSDRALIEGVFDLAMLASAGNGASDRTQKRQARDEEEREETETLADVLADLGIAPEEDGVLILSREILASGRGIARVNRRAVPVSSLQRVGRFLVDMHGQSAHLELLRPEQHVHYLDRYAGTVELQRQVAEQVLQLRATRRELERLRQDEREIERQIELLRYQVDEIEAARLRPGELEDLETERRRLANAERLGELSALAHAALAGDGESDTPGAVDLLAGAARTLGDLLRLDDSLHEHMEPLEQALYLAQEVGTALRGYQDELAADPARQAEVEERLDLLAKLRRKYGATIEAMLDYATRAATELDELTHREERAEALAEVEHDLKVQIGALAGRLSRRRSEAAGQLAAAMERELDDLNMRRARVLVRITQAPDPEGVPAELEGASAPVFYSFTVTGIDRVEFLFAPNPGEPPKPLARIASGGETSRLMLALKTILAAADIVPVLIFDEIDSGISGRSGQVVAEKLWQLGRTHQVLCVTHLAQIAALGDRHYRVAKASDDNRTSTRVSTLADGERVAEVSQMLGGANTAAARANATELLARGAAWKAASASNAAPAQTA